MRELFLDTPKVFLPLIQPSRYKGAHGGRGSGKSHHFAESMIEQGLVERGTRAVCIREVQRTLKESSKRLIEDKLVDLDLNEADGFKVFKEVIETPGDGIITFCGMQDHTAESIKSLEGYRIAWCEEAQTLSSRSLSLLRPTIREKDSELWFSWNPRRKSDAVDLLLRGPEIPTGAIVVKANWSDNPFFPDVLEQERLDCLRQFPDQYDHIWNGGYVTAISGSYFAVALAEARQQGRIGIVAADPNLSIQAFVDIGGTGARADNFVMWFAQFVASQVRVVDHYEVQGQPISAHLIWMRERKYTPGRVSTIWLPHDGDTKDRLIDVSCRTAFEGAGYAVEVVPNQGAGAASTRISSARRMFPSVLFNMATTQPGIEALGWYHEHRDENREVGLGPCHDWSSHSADAFGLMALVHESRIGRDGVGGGRIIRRRGSAMAV